MRLSRILVLAAVALFLPLAATPVDAVAGNFGNYGSKVTTAGGDFAHQLAALPVAQTPCVVREDAGTGGVFSDDNYFLHFTAAGCAAITKTLHDIQIAGPSVGTLVASSSGTYTAAVNVAAASVRYLEVDGKPGFSDLDWAYFDADQSGSLTVGDIRLFSPSSAGVTPPSTRYVAADGTDILAAASATEDTLPTTITFEAGALTLRFFDADSNALWSSGDTLVAVQPGGSTRFLSQGNLFVSTSGSRSHGTMAGSSLAGAVPILAATANVFLATTTSACAAPLSADLYIHFGGFTGAAHTHVQVGDIILRKSGDTTTGAAASYMTRVTSVATGAGTQIQASSALTAANFLYVNNPSTPTGFTSSDWLYFDVGGVCGAATGAFNAGDLRLTASNGGGSFAAGSVVVTGNSDLTTYGGATLNPDSAATPWYFLHRDVDQSLGRPLQGLTLAKYSDNTPADDLWTPGTEEVYLDVDSSGKVSTGDYRLSAGNTGLPVATSASLAPGLVAAGDADALALTTIEANADFKVTGPDGTFDGGTGEVVVHSPDAWLTPGFDRAVVTVGAVASGGLLTALETSFFGAVGASDQHILQWARTGQTTAMPIHQSHDILLGASPSFVTATSADHVPTLTDAADAVQAFARYDRTDTSPADDSYYLKATAGAPPPLSLGTLRVTPYDASHAAGTFLASGDTVELSVGATAVLSSTTEFEDAVRFIDLGLGGLDPSDPVYVDLPADVGGTNVGTFGIFDARLGAVTLNSVTYSPGAMVRPGDQDQIGYGTVWGAYAGGKQHQLHFFDENRDGVYGADDVLYLVHDVDAPAAFLVPDLLSIRLQGAGGATSNVATTTTAAAATTTAATTTTTASTTTSTVTPTATATATPTPTPTPSPTQAIGDVVADMNRAIADSLTVTRDGDGNLLAWEAQDDAGGYQVWRANSPYSYIHLIEDGAADSYLDPDGGAKSTYLVTAYTHDASGALVGTADDINVEGVPGGEDLTGVQPTKAAGAGGETEPVPAAGLLVALAALGVALFLARRRLA